MIMHLFQLSVFLLGAAFMLCTMAVADEAGKTSTDIELLIAKTKQAYDANDKEVEFLLEELYLKTTGLPDVSGKKPEGMDDVEFERRLCPFRMASSSLYSQDQIEDMRHEMRLAAYGFVVAGEQNGAVALEIINCGKDVGRQASMSKALEDGLAWAIRLKSATSGEVRAMAEEYDILRNQHPGNKKFEVLRFTVLWEAKEREKRPAQ